MNELKELFIKTESLGGFKVKELFKECFNNYVNNYKKMAELMLILKDRLEANRNNDELSLVYIEATCDITKWSRNGLDEKIYYEFCNLADEYCDEIGEEIK